LGIRLKLMNEIKKKYILSGFLIDCWCRMVDMLNIEQSLYHLIIDWFGLRFQKNLCFEIPPPLKSFQARRLKNSNPVIRNHFIEEFKAFLEKFKALDISKNLHDKLTIPLSPEQRIEWEI